jgi:hypothetical protein
VRRWLFVRDRLVAAIELIAGGRIAGARGVAFDAAVATASTAMSRYSSRTTAQIAHVRRSAELGGAQAAEPVAFKQRGGVEVRPVDHRARWMARQRSCRFAALVVVDEIEISGDAAVVEAGRDDAMRGAKAQGDELVVAVQFDGVEVGVQQHAPFPFFWWLWMAMTRLLASVGWCATVRRIRQSSLPARGESRVSAGQRPRQPLAAQSPHAEVSGGRPMRRRA